MKKRIVSLILCLSLCLCVGCSSKTDTSKGNINTQYLIAMNPSVTFSDGEVVSLRNSIAKSLTADVKGKKSSSLYNNTPWNWIVHDKNGEWYQRLVRNISLWKDRNGKTNNGVSYCYTFNDDMTDSLMPYDTTKMKIKSHKKEELGNNGIILTFSGSEEEAICYTAQEDQTVTFSDILGNKITVVSSVAGIDTDYFKNKSSKSALILRLYKNNRIYWQEVLHSKQTAVDFPTISNIDLQKDDKIIFTVQPVNDFSDIQAGYCDLPAYTKEKTKRIRKDTMVEISDENADIIPFVVDDEPNFKIVRPANASSEAISIVNNMRQKMNEVYNSDFSSSTDTLKVDGPAIYVMNTNNPNSQSILKEITDKRINNAGDYIIRTIGNDVYIVANNDVSLRFAVDFFLNNYCKKELKGISKDLNYISSNFSSLKSIRLSNTDISQYNLIISHCASRLEMEAAEYFRKEVVKSTGYLLPINNDLSKTAAKEICFGDTNRKAYSSSENSYSLLATKSVNYEYKINVTDACTTIISGMNSAIYSATIDLFDRLNKNSILSNGVYTGVASESDSYWDGYKLVWSDEFNGEKLGKSWANNNFVIANDWGGKQIPSSSNFEVKDGAVKITAKAPVDGSKDNAIGTLATLGPEKMYFKYGYLEGRVMFPKTPGVCCNLWTKGDLGSEFIEVDLCETFGNLNTLVHTVHRWGVTDNSHSVLAHNVITNDSFGNIKTFNTEFHTVGFEWGEDFMNFYVDGEQTTSIKSADLESLKKPCYMIIHAYLNYGDYSPVKLPENFVSDYVLWDYIRIYQKSNEDSFVYVKGKSN